MTSKLDFNVILAKAEKNSSNAQKLLEEKKLQQKKLLEQKKAQPSKEAALAYLEKKREEARLRADKEAKELLEKKRKKLELENQNKPKTSSNSAKPQTTNNSKPKPAVKTNEKASKNSTAKPTTTTGSQKQSAQSQKNKQKQQTTQQTKATLSYQDILKLADQNKEKPKSQAHSVALKPNNAKPSTTQSATQLNPISKLTPEQIAKLKEKQKKPMIEAQKEKLNNRPISSANSHNNANRANISNSNVNKKQMNQAVVEDKNKTIHKPGTSVSAWDRIVSDMKKNTVKPKSDNSKKNVNSNESDEGEAYESEEEYDSEMEDFIDDNEEESEEYSKCIRKLFNYDPNRYKDVEDDDDIDNMETDFHSQLREEKRSLKLGILEDIEEMKREAELERRRLEKKKKRHIDSTGDKSSDIKKIKK